MAKIRESKFRLDGHGVHKLFPDGHIEAVLNAGTGQPWRGNMRQASQEATRLNMLEGYKATATGCTYAAFPVSRDYDRVARLPTLAHGCGF